MSELTKTFTIDTEVAPIYLNDLLKFVYQYFILPHPELFTDIKKTVSDHEFILSFTALDKRREWYVNVEMKATKPIQLKMTLSSEIIPQVVLDKLKDDLVISVQLFEEKVRKTTLYFAWVKGEKIIPETMPSTQKRAIVRILTENILFFYIIFIGASILLFSVLGYYAPVVIIAFQFVTVLASDKIIMKFGKWKVDSKNPNVHLLQYHLPIEEYNEFHRKYGTDLVLKMKQEIYEKTLALGKEPNCQLGEEVFSKYGMKCAPERMSVKTVNVYDLVRKAAEKFNLPIPQIVISNTMLPNAAATGPSPSHGAMLITTGLLVQLNDDEIFSVIGHELGHLKGRDPLILFGLTASEYLLRIYVFLPFFMFSPFLYLIVAMGIVYFIAKFFEARADLQSAITIGQPQVLAEALRKIGFRRLQFERAPAHKIQGWINWDPHPPTYFRINRLEKLKTPVEVKHPLIQSVKDVINGFRAAF